MLGPKAGEWAGTWYRPTVDYGGRERIVRSSYEDPLALIWCGMLSEMGLQLRRSADVFASWDGVDTLTISDAENMDPDDCLAQMIFHEICHAWVAGPEKRSQVDWGLPLFEDGRHIEEHATNRVQATVAGRYGLRRFMATTTVHRLYYDALGEDGLRMPLDDSKAEKKSVALAIEGLSRADRGPWAQPVARALGATRALGRIVGHYVDSDSIWSGAGGGTDCGANRL